MDAVSGRDDYHDHYDYEGDDIDVNHTEKAPSFMKYKALPRIQLRRCHIVNMVNGIRTNAFLIYFQETRKHIEAALSQIATQHQQLAPAMVPPLQRWFKLPRNLKRAPAARCRCIITTARISAETVNRTTRPRTTNSHDVLIFAANFRHPATRMRTGAAVHEQTHTRKLAKRENSARPRPFLL